MPTRLERFLAARDLEAVSRLAVPRDEHTPDEDALIRRTLRERDDRLARRNLLLEPEAIPGDLVASELLDGLDDPSLPIVLAAVSGAHRSRTDLDDPGRRAIAERLIELLDDSGPELLRRRASAALLVLGFSDQAEDVLPFLDDGDPVVGHNVQAMVVRVLGSAGALAAATDGAERGAITDRALRSVDAAVDGGRATDHELVMRRVLAPQLAPITERDVDLTG